MPFSTNKTYNKNEVTSWEIPNYWDLIAIALIFTFIVLVAWGTKQMTVSYRLGDMIPISLDPSYLPGYALRTIIRILTALFFSLLFTFTFGTLAAKNKHAERIIIPAIDILQSVPVLSFLSITVTGFIFIFKNSMLGPECAAIFGIFVAQVWNMALSFYQGVKTVPKELKEAANIFQLSPWQKFWKVEVPFSMPGLLWNMMISMSGSWFFVIACEAFSVSNHQITLPGIGSYIWLATTNANNTAIIYAIICMLVVIFLYDQILFRPLVYWTEKFKEFEGDEEKVSRIWIIILFQRAKFLRSITSWLSKLADMWIGLNMLNPNSSKKNFQNIQNNKSPKFWLILHYMTLTIATISAVFFISRFLLNNVTLIEIKHVFLLGIFTGIRVITLIILAALIWIPIGVWIGLRPNVAAKIQPIIQFLAAFPANLFFPVITALIITYNLNIEIWTAPLMVLGTQWYILFNVIAGASTIPKELKLAARNFKVKGLLRWKRFILPAIAPYIVTGAITAAGGAWNASIIAEVIYWGKTRLEATGIGAYIQINFEDGNFPKLALGTIIMCILVLLINRLFWRPLYNIAIEKFGENT